MCILRFHARAGYLQHYETQRAAGGGPFVLMKPVWARPTLSSCNRLLSKYKALDLASELWPPLSRYKGDNFKLYNFVL